MFDLVPFAGSWRKVTGGDREARPVCELLQFPFPQTDSWPVASSRVGIITKDNALSYTDLTY